MRNVVIFQLARRYFVVTPQYELSLGTRRVARGLLSIKYIVEGHFRALPVRIAMPGLQSKGVAGVEYEGIRRPFSGRCLNSYETLFEKKINAQGKRVLLDR